MANRFIAAFLSSSSPARISRAQRSRASKPGLIHPAQLLAVGANCVHHALVFGTEQCDADPELQLGLGKVETFPVHRNIVAVGARDETIDNPDAGWARRISPGNIAERLAHLGLKVQADCLVARSIEVG